MMRRRVKTKSSPSRSKFMPVSGPPLAMAAFTASMRASGNSPGHIQLENRF